MISYPTPLKSTPRLSDFLGIELRIKRDDLYPATGGGNKARKVAALIPEIQAEGFNAVVTTGGIQSNHARSVALAAAEKNWPCWLILHGDTQAASNLGGNLLIMTLAGAQIKIVHPSEIKNGMLEGIEELRRKGFTPYEIPGGGHSLAGGVAFAHAAFELANQCGAWRPDWLILASGTGTTQAGLIVGLKKLAWSTHIIGISVARKNPRGSNVIKNASKQLMNHLGNAEQDLQIDFRDDWVGEGYEKADSSILESIQLAARLEGLILDPTYTGKAFAALIDMVRRGEIARDAKVVFWHTGGLLNLVASEYFRNKRTIS